MGEHSSMSEPKSRGVKRKAEESLEELEQININADEVKDDLSSIRKIVAETKEKVQNIDKFHDKIKTIVTETKEKVQKIKDYQEDIQDLKSVLSETKHEMENLKQSKDNCDVEY